MNINFYANILGTFSLFAFAIAISPTFNFLFKLSLNRRKMWHIARYGLLASVCMGLSHGLLMTQQDNINFYELNTYWTYAVGLFTFNLLAFLAFTFSELRSNYKKLNYFYYGALILLVCHVGQSIF